MTFTKLKKSLLNSALLLGFCLHNQVQADYGIDHSRWQTILDNYLATEALDSGLSQHSYFRYAKMTDQHQAMLEEYISDMQDADISNLSGDEQFAYWVNVYNAVTVQVIIDDYPVTSIMQVGSVEGKGPWDDDTFETSERSWSLNEIEHSILRPTFNDNRVHYAINCASLGCPNLSAKAYTGDNLEQQLEAAAKQFINSEKGVNFQGNSLVLSSIYSWFVGDFGGNETELIKHLIDYAEDDLKQQLENHLGTINYDYDWQLNEQ